MTTENNKLIAEFMGMTYGDPNDNSVMIQMTPQGNEVVPIESMQYHTSWDWLMPVIKKIDGYACEEMDFSDYDDYRNKYVFIHNISLHNDIREVYNQVVEFIKDNKTINN